MIKLIRIGSAKEIEYTCQKCGSLFSFEKEDLIEEPNRDCAEWAKKERYYNIFVIRCPGCHKEIIFNNEDYPFKYGKNLYSNSVILREPPLSPEELEEELRKEKNEI